MMFFLASSCWLGPWRSQYYATRGFLCARLVAKSRYRWALVFAAASTAASPLVVIDGQAGLLQHFLSGTCGNHTKKPLRFLFAHTHSDSNHEMAISDCRWWFAHIYGERKCSTDRRGPVGATSTRPCLILSQPGVGDHCVRTNIRYLDFFSSPRHE